VELLPDFARFEPPKRGQLLECKDSKPFAHCPDERHGNNILNIGQQVFTYWGVGENTQKSADFQCSELWNVIVIPLFVSLNKVILPRLYRGSAGLVARSPHFSVLVSQLRYPLGAGCAWKLG
jgi:hypothetical protein